MNLAVRVNTLGDLLLLCMFLLNIGWIKSLTSASRADLMKITFFNLQKVLFGLIR
jgi:hypothetical protein